MRLPSGENVMCESASCGDLRRSAENRSAIEIGFVGCCAFTFQKIDKIYVRRENRAEVKRIRRRHDLRVAFRWQMVQPEAALAFVQDDAQDVFAVRRDGRRYRVAVLRKLSDGEILEGNWCGAMNQ